MNQLFIWSLLATLAVLSSSVAGVESYYKFKVHRDFFKQFFEKNMNLFLVKVQNMQVKEDQRLEDVNAKLSGVELAIKPRNGNFDSYQTDVFFDEGQLVIEINDLEFSGHGQIWDAESGKTERVEFSAPISASQIVISVGETKSGNYKFPKMTIDEVILQITQDQASVSTFGDIPLYRTHNFETAVKSWLAKQMLKRQEDLKSLLQEAEKKVMGHIPFRKNFYNKVTLVSSLSENLKIEKGEHFLASFNNEFEGMDDSQFEYNLRPIVPTFSDEDDYKKDVQMVIDENVINHHFEGLFYKDQTISLVETLFSYVPDHLKVMSGVIMKLFTTSGPIGRFMVPEMLKEVGEHKRLDIRCSFSKHFLTGKMKDIHMTQLWMRDGDKLGFQTSLGCGVHYNQQENTGDMSEYFTEPSANVNWKNWRSFFVHMHANVTFDFSAETMKGIQNSGFMTGKVDDLKLELKELRVYKGDEELIKEESYWNEKFEFVRKMGANYPFFKTVTQTILQPMGIPVTPMPMIKECMGLAPIQGKIKINEGYMRLAYNFEFSQAKDYCFWDAMERTDPFAMHRARADALQNQLENWGLGNVRDQIKEKGAKIGDTLREKAEEAARNFKAKFKLPFGQ